MTIKLLSGLSRHWPEEERRMLSMTPQEKKFFIEYKAKNPANPWGYFKQYQKKLEKEYKIKQKKAA